MANSFDTERDPLEIETVAQLANHIVYRLPGCTDEMIRRSLQSAFVDFCRTSCALTCNRRFVVGHDEHICEISIVPSCSGRIVDCVKRVIKDNRILVQGRDYSICDRRIVFRYPYSDCVFVIEAVEQPIDGSEVAPSWFLKKYGNAIESGALARLMSMTGRAWSDPAQAKIEAITFNDYMTQARLAYYTGGDLSNGSMSVMPNRSESSLL